MHLNAPEWSYNKCTCQQNMTKNIEIIGKHQWHAMDQNVGQDSIILIRCLTNDKGKYTRILTGDG